MNRNIRNEFFKFLECLDKTNCLSDVVLIGAWAEFVYEENNLLDDYTPSIQTQDVDFLVLPQQNAKPKSGLVKMAKESGFIYMEDRIDGTSKFIGDENFEVEFLINRKGSGSECAVRTNIGINAQQLSHLWILSKFSMRAIIKNVSILIPEPEAYVIHKMIINDRRQNKKENDREKIQYILPKLNNSRFKEIYEFLSKREKKLVDKYLENELADN